MFPLSLILPQCDLPHCRSSLEIRFYTRRWCFLHVAWRYWWSSLEIRFYTPKIFPFYVLYFNLLVLLYHVWDVLVIYSRLSLYGRYLFVISFFNAAGIVRASRHPVAKWEVKWSNHAGFFWIHFSQGQP